MNATVVIEPHQSDAPLRILVVDDDQYDRLAVRRYLKECGAAVAVDEAVTHVATIERLRQATYDCVLLDYYIPGVDGLALLHEIHDTAPDIPIVIFTGRGDEEIAVELMKAGAVDYLPKASLTAERLASSLRHAMESSRSAAEQQRAREERERLLALEREARDEAERAIRARDEMLGIVAHDLRNPVNTIVMATSTMLELPLDEESRSRTLGIIQRSALTMDKLIRDLLDVTRIESGSFAIKRGKIHIGALLDETREQFAPQALANEVTLTCDIAPGLPPAIGDRDRLTQVLSNIIGNALKFTPARGHVELRAHPSEGFVRISVEDSGPGINTDHLPRIFDRFWQADRTSNSGTGLGMTIAKGIVEAHGGRIWVESVVGRGATFHFTVPAVPK
ncbi:MAG TPA: hybrid sensor histidine kinase/response regulator [Gemmatimonadaceae bacterium]|jgi:Osmosensitive K+ channel histidine kinase